MGSEEALEEETALELITEVPPWANRIESFACEPCWDNGIVVGIGFNKRRFLAFSTNYLLITCPRCGHCRPRYGNNAKKQEFNINKWICLYYSIFQDEMINTGMKLYREPDFEMDQFNFGKPIRIPFGVE